jgi:hypothetical protein
MDPWINRKRSRREIIPVKSGLESTGLRLVDLAGAGRTVETIKDNVGVSRIVNS